VHGWSSSPRAGLGPRQPVSRPKPARAAPPGSARLICWRTLIDAPSVLGWQRWRALEERHALGLIKGALAAIAGQGGLAPELVEVFSHVVLAAIDEIALFVARSDQPDAAMLAGTGAVDEVLSRLLASADSAYRERSPDSSELSAAQRTS
jgi:hypothetical protein